MTGRVDVAVVVPTHGRPADLAGCLGSLARLEHPRGPVEVIVVDDGSPVPAEAEAAPFRDALDLRVLRQRQAGPAAARNAGAAAARGTFLAFTDDDCEPAPDWLRRTRERLEECPDALVGGRTENGLPENPYSEASQRIVHAVYRHYNPDPGNARFFATNNLLVRRDLFLAAGGLDERFHVGAEDREFCRRWRAGGREMRHVPEALVLHRHRLDLAGFCRQHFRYGRGAYLYRRLGGRGAASELSFHLDVRNWLLRPLGDAGGAGRAARLLALLLTWQAANAAGFAREGLRRGPIGADRARSRSGGTSGRPPGPAPVHPLGWRPSRRLRPE